MVSRNNVRLVLNVLQQYRKASRIEISKYSGLSPATVTNVIQELENLGLVREAGKTELPMGRKPILIELNPDIQYLVGLDVGIGKIIGVVINLHSDIIKSIREEFNVNSDDFDLVHEMEKVYLKLIEGLPQEIINKIPGVGVSVPGLVHLEKGVLVFAPNLPNCNNVPLADKLSQLIGKPVYIENEARAMALAEARYGAARGYKNVFCIRLGYGIGGGIIINGELYRGSSYTAGEVGHMTILPSGPLCHCGNRGCLEVFAGGGAIASTALRVLSSGSNSLIREIAEDDSSSITARVVSEAAKRGDEIALKIVKDFANYIGIGIASVVNILNPEVIIVGGGVANTGELLFREIKNNVKKRAFTTMMRFPEILPSMLGEQASSIGVAAYVFEEIIRNHPEYFKVSKK